MTNPFEKFGIGHLSPSSLNLFQANPSLWCGKYLLKWSDDAGPAAKRGTAVEAGLDVFLWERNQDKACAAALDNFALNTHGVADDDYEKERGYIVPMLRSAIEAMKDAPVPVLRQSKVEHWFAGMSIPVIGYVDYVFENGLLDLKSTLRIPSKPRGDHGQQVSLYGTAKSLQPTLLYVSPARSASYPLEPTEIAEHMRDLERAARTLQHALDKSESPQDFAKFYCPNFEDFRWSDSTRNLAQQFYAPL